LIEGFRNKPPMVRESNPLILRVLLNLVKKSVVNLVGTEHLDVLMHHDWRKCKPSLVEFIQNSKLSLPALEYIKNMGILNQPTAQTKRSQGNEKLMDGQVGFGSQLGRAPVQSANVMGGALKTFYSSIQGLIPKMSNPDPTVRLQAAEIALGTVRSVPAGALSESSIEPTPAIS
jgi:hypothetical protein